MQAGISQIILQDMSVLAPAVTTLPLYCIFWILGGLLAKAEGQTYTSSVSLHLLHNKSTIWISHPRGDPISRHSSWPDRTGLLVAHRTASEIPTPRFL